MSDYLPLSITRERHHELTTYADLVAYLLDAFNVSGQSPLLRHARRVVGDCVVELARVHEWTYYARQGLLTTIPAYSTGTVAYTASTRTVTLTGGTFPTTATEYSLRLSEQEWVVSARPSATTLTLEQGPATDLAAGTPYTLHQSEYPIPPGVRRLGRFWTNCRELTYCPYGDRYTTWRSGEPHEYSIRGSRRLQGTNVVVLSPCPDQAITYNYDCYYAPATPRMWGKELEYRTGTVTVNGASVTGTGTTWDSRMVGTVLRVSADGTAPTGEVGHDGVDNPYWEQRMVTAVASATSLTVDAPFSAAVSGRGYTLGDVIDVDGTMRPTLHRLLEWRFSRFVEKPVDQSKLTRIHVEREAVYRQSLRESIAADSRYLPPGPQRWYVVPTVSREVT